MKSRGELVNADTGERATVFDGPMMTAGDIILVEESPALWPKLCVDLADAVLDCIQRGSGAAPKAFLVKSHFLGQTYAVKQSLQARYRLNAADVAGYRLEALWTALRQPAWRRADNPLAYLRYVVRAETSRVVTNREQADRLWDKAVDEPVLTGDEDVLDALAAVAGCDGHYRVSVPKGEGRQQTGGTPAALRIPDWQTAYPGARGRMLDVLEDLATNGTDRDRHIIDALAAGATPDDAVRQSAASTPDWSGLQTLQRKAKLRLRKA